jgi:hypothetical protein
VKESVDILRGFGVGRRPCESEGGCVSDDVFRGFFARYVLL